MDTIENRSPLPWEEAFVPSHHFVHHANRDLRSVAGWLPSSSRLRSDLMDVIWHFLIGKNVLKAVSA